MVIARQGNANQEEENVTRHAAGGP
jgi:hypothetical protein